MNDPMLPLPGLSSASGKPVVVKFDGGLLSSDGGVLALREVEQRLRVVAATACAVEFVLLRVGCLRSFKPAIHFGAKFRLPRLHAFVAHRLVFGGVRLDLRAVERDMPQLCKPGLFRQLQHLQKQPPQRRQMTLPEVGDRTKIWRVVRHDHMKSTRSAHAFAILREE